MCFYINLVEILFGSLSFIYYLLNFYFFSQLLFKLLLLTARISLMLDFLLDVDAKLGLFSTDYDWDCFNLFFNYEISKLIIRLYALSFFGLHLLELLYDPFCDVCVYILFLLFDFNLEVSSNKYSFCWFLHIWTYLLKLNCSWVSFLWILKSSNILNIEWCYYLIFSRISKRSLIDISKSNKLITWAFLQIKQILSYFIPSYPFSTL